MSSCVGNINTFCYVCGKYVVLCDRIHITPNLEHIYGYYFSTSYWPRAWAPNICCRTCYNGLVEWYNGTKKSMPFGIPMIWNEPSENRHDSTTCYVCVNDAKRQNKRQLKYFQYRAVPSVELPKPHSEDVPVPKRPSPQTANLSTCEDLAKLPDAPSLPGPTPSEINPSIYVEGEVRRPVLLDEQKLNTIARNLNLSKNKAEMLAAELQQYNLLEEGVSARSFRIRNSRFKQFFTVNPENTFVYCNNVSGLFDAMHIANYRAQEWRLFIDSSQSSLKGTVL